MKKAIRYKPQPLKLEEKDRLTGTGKELDYLRALRKPLIRAFREYETDVNYGIVTESTETHEEMLNWYMQINSDNLGAVSLLTGTEEEQARQTQAAIQDAIENTPEEIKKYLNGV